MREILVFIIVWQVSYVRETIQKITPVGPIILLSIFVAAVSRVRAVCSLPYDDLGQLCLELVMPRVDVNTLLMQYH